MLHHAAHTHSHDRQNARHHYLLLHSQAQPLFPQLLQRALELIRGCTCRAMSGCPACIQHLGCTEYNAVLHKRAAITVLECTLAAETEYVSRMQQQQVGHPQCIE
jgi:DEAD/DEAH box helicase domain-containing protein